MMKVEWELIDDFQDMVMDFDSARFVSKPYLTTMGLQMYYKMPLTVLDTNLTHLVWIV